MVGPAPGRGAAFGWPGIPASQTNRPGLRPGPVVRATRARPPGPAPDLTQDENRPGRTPGPLNAYDK